MLSLSISVSEKGVACSEGSDWLGGQKLCSSAQMLRGVHIPGECSGVWRVPWRRKKKGNTGLNLAYEHVDICYALL